MVRFTTDTALPRCGYDDKSIIGMATHITRDFDALARFGLCVSKWILAMMKPTVHLKTKVSM